MTQEYIDAKELSRLLGLKTPTLYKLTKGPDAIPHYRIGEKRKKILYKKEDVLNWIEKHKAETEVA